MAPKKTSKQKQAPEPEVEAEDTDDVPRSVRLEEYFSNAPVSRSSRILEFDQKSYEKHGKTYAESAKFKSKSTSLALIATPLCKDNTRNGMLRMCALQIKIKNVKVVLSKNDYGTTATYRWDHCETEEDSETHDALSEFIAILSGRAKEALLCLTQAKGQVNLLTSGDIHFSVTDKSTAVDEKREPMDIPATGSFHCNYVIARLYYSLTEKYGEVNIRPKLALVASQMTKIDDLPTDTSHGIHEHAEEEQDDPEMSW